MSWTSIMQSADLVRRDDGSSNDNSAVPFNTFVIILVLLSVFMLALTPLVFLAPIGGRRSIAANDVEAIHQRRQPRSIAIHHTRDDEGFIQIDIIDVPPESTDRFARNLHHHQRQQSSRSMRDTTANPTARTKLSHLAKAAGTTLATRSAALYQSIRHGFAKMKMPKWTSGDEAASERKRARRERMRGLSIDLPVMRQPAWQRLASGALSPATTLGDFIRHGMDDASTTGTVNRTPETHLCSSTPEQQQQEQHMTEVAEMEENACKGVAQGTSREIHETGVDAHGHDDTHGQVEIQMPEPVFMMGLGIAR